MVCGGAVRDCWPFEKSLHVQQSGQRAKRDAYSKAKDGRVGLCKIRKSLGSLAGSGWEESLEKRVLGGVLFARRTSCHGLQYSTSRTRPCTPHN